MHIEAALNVVPGAYRDVGPLLHRLATWKRACSSLALITGGAEPVIAPSGDFGADENGFVLRGERIVDFGRMSTDRPGTEHHSCLAFTLDETRIDGVIAPAVRPEGHNPAEAMALFAKWHDNEDEDDGLFVSDIDGPVQINSRSVELGEDVFLIGRLRLPVADVVWAEFEDGGDGVYHLHLILGGGRFYHVTGGDFSS